MLMRHQLLEIDLGPGTTFERANELVQTSEPIGFLGVANSCGIERPAENG